MKNNLRFAFFTILIVYIIILKSGLYVSVYITYFSIPTLVILGIFAFGNINNIHKTAKYTFFLGLVLTLITIFSVSYIGVYLVYIVIPILVVSGAIMLFTKNSK